MSIDKSLKRKSAIVRQRSVLNREERIKQLQSEERWQEGRSPFGLPKVKVVKIVLKKAKKAKTEEAAEGAAGSAAGETKSAAAGKAAAPAKEAAKKK